MKILKLVSLISILFTLSGCVGGSRTHLAAAEDEDYGIGGTGLVAQNLVGEGMGVIGEITGFGSIFVNGVEVENDDSTIISVNGKKVSGHDFEIGEVVEILTRDEQPLTNAVLINVRHEVIGPVSSVDRSRQRLTVLNQTVLIDDLPADIETGAFLAVSGFRDGKGQIHATRVAASKPGSVLVRGQLERAQNGLSMHGFELAFSAQPQPGQYQLKIEGTLVDGKINVTRAVPDGVANFRDLSTWVVQGFPATYASAWKENEDLAKISGQSRPVIFRFRQAVENKPAKILLMPDDLPKGAKVSSGQKTPVSGNQSSSGRGGTNSGGSGNSSEGGNNNGGGSANGKGDSGNDSGGGGKP
jgi:hypothetical protein